jgi:hypothetical protein
MPSCDYDTKYLISEDIESLSATFSMVMACLNCYIINVVKEYLAYYGNVDISWLYMTPKKKRLFSLV